MGKEVEKVKHWLEAMVIGHNFCPFAARPYKKDLIRYVTVDTDSVDSLIDILIDELLLLSQADINDIETSILIMPNLFKDFEEYNQFGVILDQLIDSLKLNGVIQIATFHPDYQFADLAADDVRNYTNRSPYPLFHLIREDSVEKARASYPDIEEIPDKNMQKLESLGLDKVKKTLEKL